MVQRKFLLVLRSKFPQKMAGTRQEGQKIMEIYTLYERAAGDITDDVRTYALDKDPVVRDVRHDSDCRQLT